MELIEKITLPNGLVVEVHDCSRLIARDTVHVRMAVRMEVVLEERFFEDRRRCEAVKAVFGPVLVYEHRKERTFTPLERSRAVFSKFLEDFRKDVLPYLGRPQFAERFCQAKYREIKEHPERYARFPGEAGPVGEEEDEDRDLASLLGEEEEKSGGGA